MTENELIGTRWVWKRFNSDIDDSEVEFHNQGQLYENGILDSNRDWSILDGLLIINCYDFSTYTGSLAENVIAGSAKNIKGKSWTFTMELISGISIPKNETIPESSDSQYNAIDDALLAIELIGTKWEWRQDDVEIADTNVNFQKNDIFIDEFDDSLNNRWIVLNETIIIDFNDDYVKYRGRKNGNIITGDSENIIGEKWEFRMELIQGNQVVQQEPTQKIDDSKDAEVVELPTYKFKREFKFYYFYPYYPTRFAVSSELDEIRHYIWNFKDGLNSKHVADAISSDFEKIELESSLSSWWLSIIPASTEDKTRKRFKQFCDLLCQNTGMNNGYNLIVNSFDREAAHLSDNRDSVDVIESVNFSNVSGKHILLFDDVYTTGKSFLKVARKLKSLDAKEVVGLFLGKTHWIEE